VIDVKLEGIARKSRNIWPFAAEPLILHHSLECSKADWPSHKSKCMSEKNINAMLDKINAEMDARPVKRPSQKRCTGCGVKFTEDYEAEDACDDCG